ncbi:hypothetical protein [Sanguibacter sp. HDW7]|uniref:hypothetical protein n=1 Tax=Sanguibacter sp. HDW7 TaxID=2714931 RepID=UPI0014078F49|nr:hypothetical protein [Sanguibacter sp. HDW7]QIK84496.1 hypothetical protein G7063_13405 [Sanguibacter sp. HDW7]
MSTTPADQPDPTRPADENHDFFSTDAESPIDETAAPERAAADAARVGDGDAPAPDADTTVTGAAEVEAAVADAADETAADAGDAATGDAATGAAETGAAVNVATDASAADDEAAEDEVPPTLTSFPDAAHPVVLDRETLRRAPRFGRFALVAVLGGLLLGVVLGYVVFPASHPGWSRTIFAFEVMLVTLALTLLAALASDWRSRRPRRR